MKRHVAQTKCFEDSILKLIAKKKLSELNFEEFKNNLVINPVEGDIIAGTGGVRKTRLRVCYLDLEDKLILFLLFIYQKNDQEDLTSAEKKELKRLVKAIKE